MRRCYNPAPDADRFAQTSPNARRILSPASSSPAQPRGRRDDAHHSRASGGCSVTIREVGRRRRSRLPRAGRLGPQDGLPSPQPVLSLRADRNRGRTLPADRDRSDHAARSRREPAASGYGLGSPARRFFARRCGFRTAVARTRRGPGPRRRRSFATGATACAGRLPGRDLGLRLVPVSLVATVRPPLPFPDRVGPLTNGSIPFFRHRALASFVAVVLFRTRPPASLRTVPTQRRKPAGGPRCSLLINPTATPAFHARA
jgi:hypothetical protein